MCPGKWFFFFLGGGAKSLKTLCHLASGTTKVSCLPDVGTMSVVVGLELKGPEGPRGHSEANHCDRDP